MYQKNILSKNEVKNYCQMYQKNGGCNISFRNQIIILRNNDELIEQHFKRKIEEHVARGFF